MNRKDLVEDLKLFKQENIKQLNKNSLKIIDNAKNYKSDKLSQFIIYLNQSKNLPKLNNKYFNITNKDFKLFLNETTIKKSFMFSLKWTPEDWNNWFSFYRKISNQFLKTRINIYIEGDQKYQIPIFIKNNKLTEIQKKLITGSSDVRYLLGFSIFDEYMKNRDLLIDEMKQPKENRNTELINTLKNKIEQLGNIKKEIKYTILTSKRIKESLLKQKFKAGGTCFFDAIEKYIDNSKDNNIKKVKNKIQSKINQLKLKYNNGVSSSDLENISDFLNLSFKIYSADQLSSIHHINKNSNSCVEMINNRENHVEYFKQNEIEVTKEQIINLRNELFKNNQYHLYKSDKLLYTIDTKYINKETNNDLYLKFLKQVENYKLKLNTKLHDFVDQAYSQGGTILYEEKENNLLFKNTEANILKLTKSFYTEGNEYLYDHYRSYSKHKDCKFYNGFPTVFIGFCEHNFTIDFISKNIGIYKITNIDYSNANKNIQEHINKLNLFHHTIFTSPELLFYNSLNIKFDIIVGAYCRNSFDLEFDEEIIKNKLYTEYIGKLASKSETHNFKVFTTNEHASLLKSDFKSNAEMYTGLDYVDVEYPKSNCYSYTHISAFFTAYSRIQILEQLFNIPVNQVIGIQLDGIFTKNEIKPLNNFRKKIVLPNKTIWANEYYIYGRNIDSDYQLPKLPKYISNKNLYLLGAGGTGKTHSILNDNLLDILYLSKCYVLGYNKSIEYNTQYSVFDIFNKNKPTQGYIKHFQNKPHPNIIFLDEYSMISNNYVTNINHYFPNSLIIIANDINKKGQPYQLSIDKQTYTIPKDYEIIEYTKNYRIKCNKLKTLIDEVRELIDLNIDPLPIVKNTLKNIKIDELKELYNYKTDYILCSLKNGYDENTDYVYQYSKIFNSEKYIVIENKHPYYNGQIILDKNLKIKKEQRDAFTAHAIQGQTIKSPSKIFIDPRKLFDKNQIYVMISRAEYLDQLYIINEFYP